MRKAFTLVEVLVTIFIITILVALLVPAVQCARSYANRTVCANRMRQLALAVHAYESASGGLPRLLIGREDTVEKVPSHSLRSAILPQLEQHGVFNLLHLDRHVADPSNQPAIKTVLAAYLCPVSPARLPQATPADGQWLFRGLQRNGQSDASMQAAMCDYLPNGGYNRVSTPEEETTGKELAPYHGEGIWARYSRGGVRRLDEVADGLSNVIMWGEQAGRPDRYLLIRQGVEKLDIMPYDKFGTQFRWGMDGAWAASTGAAFQHEGVADEPRHVNMNNFSTLYGFHPASAGVAMADGSVRHLPESTHREVVAKLFIVDDGSPTQQ